MIRGRALVVDSSRTDTSAIAAVFDADLGHHAVRPGDASDLVWSPTDSQDKLLGLIGFYIHGKVIEADYGTAHAKVFIGSENFSSTSLNHNRELGLIISNSAILSAIARSFAADFAGGKRWA